VFTKSTVFILGAGSNVDYGFFTGTGLKNYCANEFQKNYPKYLLESGAYNGDALKAATRDAKDLRKVISADLHENIDHLLAMHPKQEDVGKMAIVDAILHGERRSKELPLPKHDLYQSIFGLMVSGVLRPSDLSRVVENRATFISFNYDRSLEYFLYNQLRRLADWDRSPVPFGDVYRKLASVHHVYGSLGPFLGEDGVVPYGATPTIQTLIDCGGEIDVIYGGKKPRCNTMIAEALGTAEAVFYLGFGYDENNMKILGLPTAVGKGTAVLGTGVNVHDDVRERATSSLKGHLKPTVLNHITDLDCVKFVDDIVAPYSQGKAFRLR